jgi:hypothetical protein
MNTPPCFGQWTGCDQEKEELCKWGLACYHAEEAAAGLDGDEE